MTSTQTVSSSNLLGFEYVLGEDTLGLGMCAIVGHVFALAILHFVCVRRQNRVTAKEALGLTALICLRETLA